MSAGFLACNTCGYFGSPRMFSPKECPECKSRDVDQDDDTMFDNEDQDEEMEF